jgi:hypothetical protein
LINSQTELGDFPQQVIDLFLCTQREEIMRKEREREREREREKKKRSCMPFKKILEIITHKRRFMMRFSGNKRQRIVVCQLSSS